MTGKNGNLLQCILSLKNLCNSTGYLYDPIFSQDVIDAFFSPEIRLSLRLESAPIDDKYFGLACTITSSVLLRFVLFCLFVLSILM